MTLSSFAQLAARLATADADMRLAQEAILEKAADDRGRGKGYWNYKYGWPQLAESTSRSECARLFSK